MNMFDIKRDEVNGEKYAVCKFCKDYRVIKMTKSNTSGLHRHVTRYHNRVYNKGPQEETFEEVNKLFLIKVEFRSFV